MTRMTNKTFDCVKMMRDIRGQLDTQMAGMTPDERIRWIRSHPYSDPILKRLVRTARGGTENGASG